MFPQYNITDIWGNIYNKGDKFIEHNHTNTEFGETLNYGQYITSGIIYLTDSEQGCICLN